MYAYGVLMVSGVAAAAGLVLAAVSTLVVINPSSGLSGWERVLVGAPTVLDEGLELAEAYLDDQGLPDACTGTLPEDDPDFEWCADLEAQAAEPIVPEETDQAIALVKEETLRQVRQSAIARLVAGAVVFVIAAVVFSRHRRLVSLYGQDGQIVTSGATVTSASEVPPPPPA